ncbi:exonuclease SbcCD subunit D [Glutamicibacter sp. 287]|uniref:exonuclease SbcCD subunit D n=1 Tax=unclassified Glutamicibacter TaxID=2627139 RepID=UPI000BB748A0|nr:exonuclease SbcCD subunit D [Glutamicibacter sp. BW80]PCC29633.1 exonuclease SbcCD subunit D [Glutamicibacter sp. BW80]
MRLLHTSDWHLGRTFHGASLLETQRSVLQEIIDITRERQVDAVLVAGDIYDRALPHVDAVRLCNWALGELRKTGATLILTSGNHDSASRLGFASALLDSAGVHIFAEPARMLEPVLLDGEDHQVAVYGIPYLEPRMVMDELQVDRASHEAVAGAALARIEGHLAELRQQGSPVVSVAMAHLFAAGGQGSDSERELSTGNLDVVPAHLFENFDYTALGHLHGRQRITEHIRYSGSPLAYSFSEVNQRKGVWLIDTGAEGITGYQEVILSVPKKLAVLRGNLDDLLADESLEYAQDAWCQVTLTDPERPADAMSKVRTRFPDTVVLAFDPQGGKAKEKSTYSERMAKATSTAQVCSDFIEHVRDRHPDDLERELLESVIRSTREAQVSK